MKGKTHISLVSLLALGAALAVAQTPPPVSKADPSKADSRSEAKADPFTESGQIITGGRTASYVIHYLPPSSFPDLPGPIADLLVRRGCMIPQTYEAHRPENVIKAAFEHAGSADWALLCSVKGVVALMVFFASATDRPIVLATTPETQRLQAHGSSRILGFNWGIDPASPERVHEAQTGLPRRPPPPDHDALEDTILDHRAVFHLYAKGKWTLVDLPE
jgi:hypothetical protein